MVMIAALLFLTTANFWVYAGKKEKQTVSSAAGTSDEEQGSGSSDPNPGSSAPNPVEEKNANTLQNLSEYLHDHHCSLTHPVCTSSFGNRHDIINLPIHHPELLASKAGRLIFLIIHFFIDGCTAIAFNRVTVITVRVHGIRYADGSVCTAVNSNRTNVIAGYSDSSSS